MMIDVELVIVTNCHKSRSSHKRRSVRKGVLRNFAKFTKFTFLVKLQDEACNFIKRRLWHRCFSCEFCGIFKNTFFTEHLMNRRVLREIFALGRFYGLVCKMKFLSFRFSWYNTIFSTNKNLGDLIIFIVLSLRVRGYTTIILATRSGI